MQIAPARCLHNVADDRLPAIVHRNMLDRDLLLAARAVALECFHLNHMGPRQLDAFRRLIDEQIGLVEIKLQGLGEPTSSATSISP